MKRTGVGNVYSFASSLQLGATYGALEEVAEELVEAAELLAVELAVLESFLLDDAAGCWQEAKISMDSANEEYIANLFFIYPYSPYKKRTPGQGVYPSRRSV